MFGSVGWGEILILVAAGLIVLGPERLPGAVSWSLKSLRQVRDYASGATSQLKDELGPEFEDLRKPLADLSELRGMTPTGFVTKHLLDGDSTLLSPSTYVGDAAKPLSAPDAASSTPRSAKAEPAEASRPTSSKPQPGKRHDMSDWDAT